MDAVQNAFSNCKDLLHQALDTFYAAPAPARIAGYASGCLLGLYGLYYVWYFGRIRRVRSNVTLRGKTVIITGANAGIGRETAVDLASRGARVIMACRNPTKAQAAMIEIRRRSGNDNVVFRQLDTSDLESVRAFVQQILKEEDRVDILINNAGIGASKRKITPEGFDLIMATNHVGHFVLTMSLIDKFRECAPSRIINVSSKQGHEAVTEVDFTDKSGKGIKGSGYKAGFQRYGRTKLANILFTRELARRLAGTGVTTYSLHPGEIYSSIWDTSYTTVGKRHIYFIVAPLINLFMMNEKDGAQTTIYCAIDENITNLSGRYFSNCGLAKESSLARDDTLAKQLWDVTCEATGIDKDVLK